MVRMNNRKISLNSDKKTINIILVFLLIIILLKIASGVTEKVSEMITSYSNSNEINILSSYENSYMEDEVEKYAEKEGIDVNFEYMGDLDMVDELNKNSESYDAVWISNSMWLYMLENPYLYSDSKSISISPVVFGIKENKAKELGLTDKNVTNTDIMNLIKENKIKYVMNSVTQTNTGATAYLGFLTSLAGNPEVLTESMIHNESLINNLKASNKLDDTVIVITGDHYPYTLSVDEINEISSYERDELFEVNHSNLIIWNNNDKIIKEVDKVGSQIDVLPTILNLFGVSYDSRLLIGNDILSDTEGLAIFSDHSFISDNGKYINSTKTFIPNNSVNLTDNYLENMKLRVDNSFIASKMILETDIYRKVIGDK